VFVYRQEPFRNFPAAICIYPAAVKCVVINPAIAIAVSNNRPEKDNLCGTHNPPEKNGLAEKDELPFQVRCWSDY